MRKLLYIIGVILLLLLDLSSCRTKKVVIEEKTDSVFHAERETEKQSEIHISVEYPTNFDSVKLDSLPFLLLPLSDGKQKIKIPLMPGARISYNETSKKKINENVTSKKKQKKDENIKENKKECHYVIPLLIVLILFCLCVKFRKKIKKTFVYIRNLL